MLRISARIAVAVVLVIAAMFLAVDRPTSGPLAGNFPTSLLDRYRRCLEGEQCLGNTGPAAVGHPNAIPCGEFPTCGGQCPSGQACVAETDTCYCLPLCCRCDGGTTCESTCSAGSDDFETFFDEVCDPLGCGATCVAIAICGDGSFASCAPLGGCCLPDGRCSPATENACGTRSGTYHGAGTSCQSLECPLPNTPPVVLQPSNC